MANRNISESRFRQFALVFASLIVAAMQAVNAPAQSGASIAGTVTDQDNASIAGATVKAANVASGRITIVRTDSSGVYRITGLQPGPYRIRASGEGFADAVKNITIRAAGKSSIDFLLSPGAIEDVVTVTAGKGNARAAVDIPQTVTIADAQEVETRRPRSALEALEKAPNLTTIGSNPLAERPRLRGLSANRLLVIIDGERLNNFRSDPISGISPGVVDMTQLEFAEVVGGANSSLYGSDALSGTINLITKAPARSDAKQILSARFDGDVHGNGLFRRGGASLNWSIPQVALRLSGSIFGASNYHAGNKDVSIDEVVRLGRFAVEMGNAAQNNVARTFAVWSLPFGAEILNGRARGFNDQVDLWLFPSEAHAIRYRQLNSQHKAIQFPFIAPPFDGREQSNGFRRLDKFGFRYEGRELKTWLPHLATGFYRQKYSFADDNFVSAIEEGSSWQVIQTSPETATTVLTGRPSTFALANFTSGKNSVTSYGADLQATLLPFAGAVVTTGVGFLRDYSKDDFSRVDFDLGTSVPVEVVAGRASNPDSVYRNLGWFNLFEYEPRAWLRLTGGFRVDNWKTEAKVTGGFPLGTEAAILDASLSSLLASPGQINIEGLTGVTDLVRGSAAISTSNTIATGNAGVIARTRAGVNFYFRWANSYREPGITERYILRNFGDPTFSVLLAANTRLRPERGNSYDAGVKIRRSRFSGSAAYFRNDFKDFLKPSFSDVLFIPADPARGLQPIAPGFPFHGVLYVQRTNTARARIEGFEGDFEASLALGRRVVLTPFAVFGYLKGADLTPDPNALRLIDQFYNRADTPIRLEGSATDAPLSGITPRRVVAGARYSSIEGRWSGEYRVRYQSRVERVDPLDLSTTIVTQYGTLRSLGGFAVHSLRAGFTHRKENYRLSFVMGIDNLTNRFYFEHFQNAPARGRSFVLGVTTDFWNLLSR